MPNKSQGQPRRPGEQQNGGSEQGSPIQNVGQHLQEGAAAVGHRVRDGYDSARDEAARRFRRAEGSIARNPGPSVLLGFGVGFGLGLILTAILAEGHEETWSEWAEHRARTPLKHARRTMKSAHEAAGHAQEALHHLPDAFHRLADAVREMPEAIARHLPGR